MGYFDLTAFDSSRESEDERQAGARASTGSNGAQLLEAMMANRLAVVSTPARVSTQRAALPESLWSKETLRGVRFAIPESPGRCIAKEPGALHTPREEKVEDIICAGGVQEKVRTVLHELQAEMDQYQDMLEVLCNDLYADFVFAVHGHAGPQYYAKVETMAAFEHVIGEFEEIRRREFDLREDVDAFLTFAKERLT